MNDIRISGSGSVGGGEYNSVHISGSGRIDGAVTCKTYASSGSSRVKGGIKCDEFASSGASHIEGSVDCSGTFSTSGAAHIDGDLHGDTAKCSGSLSGGKNIDIREGRFFRLSVCRGRCFRGKGGFERRGAHQRAFERRNS